MFACVLTCLVGRVVEFYQEGEKCPVAEFLDTLPGKTAQKVLWVLKLVEEIDWVPIQYFKKLEGTDEIWEVRADFGRSAIRLLGFWSGGAFIVLTNGFQKKSQKTPIDEINLAEERRRKYLGRRP